MVFLALGIVILIFPAINIVPSSTVIRLYEGLVSVLLVVFHYSHDPNQFCFVLLFIAGHVRPGEAGVDDEADRNFSSQ